LSLFNSIFIRICLIVLKSYYVNIVKSPNIIIKSPELKKNHHITKTPNEKITKFGDNAPTVATLRGDARAMKTVRVDLNI
jgi:hypothetical protein